MYTESLHEAFLEREGSVRDEAVGDAVDFVAHAGHPFALAGHVAEDPGGVDARVELAREEGAEDELRGRVSLGDLGSGMG